ncbi:MULTISPECIES: hypothetical protein [Acinetobacter]|uniref:Uncharacterized protein n=1 Tax=Acinetobacter pittii TaxID=48296 RepID=A0A242U4M4_ACIPI|nr:MULTISPECIES: hypothetical protein [Acinetobacter]EXS24304.1 hypothetical protein J658_1177 [Acinetobacter baumannii 573719]MBJ8471659.1 hypothetical protein [Acinetobacter pittii]MBJ8500035.1 hypothetical protein [Acinetobacter pittii]MBJ9890777.1 hypothetical protein [Acinetobacter pittii]MCU4477319.1 hypothetical protein [Acinetobacter sp. WU_MDCI_Abxd143]
MDAKFHSENDYGFILNILNHYVVIKKSVKDNYYPYDSFGYLLALYQPLKVYIPQLPHPKIYIEIGGISYDRVIVMQTEDEKEAMNVLMELEQLVV